MSTDFAQSKRSAGRAFALQCALAVLLGTAFTALGFLPASSGYQYIQYGSFAGHALGYIVLQLAPLGSPELPAAFWYVAYLIIAVGYLLLLTLPAYFFFRRGRSWFIALQLLALALHGVFALFIVAPWWRRM